MSTIATYHWSDFPLDRLRDLPERVSVCLPTLNESATIVAALEALEPARLAGIVDEIVVVDSGSTDGTVQLAERAGAEVAHARDLHPELGPVLGKGDAMWRALEVLAGDVVCYLDADTADLPTHFALGLVGALVADPEAQLAKACYRRPFRAGSVTMPAGGGRVNELVGRPLLRAFYPELGTLRQPLAGEVAARRELLERLPFATGYAVEMAMLLDTYRLAGARGIVQVDLEERQNRHQSLEALGPMADAVLAAVLTRLRSEGRLAGVEVEPVVERPPRASLSVRS